MTRRIRRRRLHGRRLQRARDLAGLGQDDRRAPAPRPLRSHHARHPRPDDRAPPASARAAARGGGPPRGTHEPGGALGGRSRLAFVAPGADPQRSVAVAPATEAIGHREPRAASTWPSSPCTASTARTAPSRGCSTSWGSPTSARGRWPRPWPWTRSWRRRSSRPRACRCRAGSWSSGARSTRDRAAEARRAAEAACLRW